MSRTPSPPPSPPLANTRRTRRRLAPSTKAGTPYPPAIRAGFEALLQCARRLGRQCDPASTVAVADLGTACEDLQAQLLAVRERSVRQLADAQARATCERRTQAARGARFMVVKLTAASTGDRGRVWRLHRARLDVEAREATAVCDAVEALVEATVAAHCNTHITTCTTTTTAPCKVTSITGTVVAADTRTRTILHLRRQAIDKKRKRRTFYVCSGALTTADGTCQAVHCGHSGAQRAQPTHVRRDAEHHVIHVHRAPRATDGYAGSGLVATEGDDKWSEGDVLGGA